MAKIVIEIPDEIVAALGNNPEKQARFALEATTVEAYRQGRFAQAQCTLLLAIPRVEFNQMLAERQVAHPLTTKHLIDGFQAIDKLFPE